MIAFTRLKDMATTTSSTAIIALTDTGNAPKRVILRLQVNEFDGEGHSWEQHVDAIKAYLVWAGRSASEYEGDYDKRKHFAHVEPFQAPEVKQTTFHVVLDMEQHSLESPNLDDVPHEIYCVCRDKDGNL
jgi:hypothetical protein